MNTSDQLPDLEVHAPPFFVDDGRGGLKTGDRFHSGGGTGCALMLIPGSKVEARIPGVEARSSIPWVEARIPLT